MNGQIEIPADLLESIARGQCLLFVGPWASTPLPKRAGPPGPDTLAAELAHRLQRLPEDMTLPWVAQLYKDTRGEHGLRTFVARRMNSSEYRPTHLHHQIARLGFPVIVDTALDRLLKDLLQASRDFDYSMVIEDDDTTFATEPLIYKLYGACDRPPSMRVTEDSRQNLPLEQPQIMREITARVHSWPQLFIGYRKNHPSFRFLYRLLRDDGDNGNMPAAYIVEQDPTPELEKGYWSKRSLQMIEADPTEFMVQLSRRLNSHDPLEAAAVDEPRPLTAEEQQEIKEVFDFVLQRAGVSEPVESGVQLQTVAHNQHFLGALWAEVGPSLERDSPQVDLQLAHAAWASKEIDQAVRLFHKAIEDDPGQVDARISLHTLLAEQGDVNGSLEQYNLAIAKDPERKVLPDRYDITAVLGVGNLGIAYKAVDTKTGKTLSVMLLHSMFSRESRADDLAQFEEGVSRLDHPRIPHFVQCGHHRGRRFVARDFINGQILARQINGDPARADQPLPVPETLAILSQAAQAVAYAHEQDVLHLGISPYTVLTTPDRGAMVVDFGEARLVADQHYLTGTHIESADYLAPEQLAGRPVDERSDVFALGSLAYSMLTGRPLGPGSMEPISGINPEVDDGLDLFVSKAVAFDPDQRFASVADMRDELQRLAALSGGGTGYQAMIYTQRTLRSVSKGMASITGWPRWPGLLIVMVLIVVLDNLADARMLQIHFVSRMTLVLILGIVPASLFCYWRIRELARVSGMGSLVHGARGFGAIFGLVMSLLIIWKTAWHPEFDQGVANVYKMSEMDGGPWPFGYAVLAGLFTFGMSYVMLVIAAGGGQVARREWNIFPAGFYLTYLVFIVILFTLLISPWLFRLITFPEASV